MGRPFVGARGAVLRRRMAAGQHASAHERAAHTKRSSVAIASGTSAAARMPHGASPAPARPVWKCNSDASERRGTRLRTPRRSASRTTVRAVRPRGRFPGERLDGRGAVAHEWPGESARDGDDRGEERWPAAIPARRSPCRAGLSTACTRHTPPKTRSAVHAHEHGQHERCDPEAQQRAQLALPGSRCARSGWRRTPLRRTRPADADEANGRTRASYAPNAPSGNAPPTTSERARSPWPEQHNRSPAENEQANTRRRRVGRPSPPCARRT